MRITTWAEYGLICAVHLAQRPDEGPITGREMAAAEKLPADYVEQILLRLRRAGIVKSTRGAHGGYSLADSPSNISVRAVIKASELVTFDLHCVTHPIDEVRCSKAESCSIRPVWMLLQQRIDEVLEGVKLSDLLHEERAVRERVGLNEEEPGADSSRTPEVKRAREVRRTAGTGAKGRLGGAVRLPVVNG